MDMSPQSLTGRYIKNAVQLDVPLSTSYTKDVRFSDFLIRVRRAPRDDFERDLPLREVAI